MASNHQGSDIEGWNSALTAHGDSDGFEHLVLLHASKNLKVRVVYLFMKTCHIQRLLVPGTPAVGGQFDLGRTVVGKEVRSGSPTPTGNGRYTEQTPGFIAIYPAYCVPSSQSAKNIF